MSTEAIQVAKLDSLIFWQKNLSKIEHPKMGIDHNNVVTSHLSLVVSEWLVTGD